MGLLSLPSLACFRFSAPKLRRVRLSGPFLLLAVIYSTNPLTDLMTLYPSSTVSSELFDTSDSDRTSVRLPVNRWQHGGRQEERPTRVWTTSRWPAGDKALYKLKTVACLVKVWAKYSCGAERESTSAQGKAATLGWISWTNLVEWSGTKSYNSPYPPPEARRRAPLT